MCIFHKQTYFIITLNIILSMYDMRSVFLNTQQVWYQVYSFVIAITNLKSDISPSNSLIFLTDNKHQLIVLIITTDSGEGGGRRPPPYFLPEYFSIQNWPKYTKKLGLTPIPFRHVLGAPLIMVDCNHVW